MVLNKYGEKIIPRSTKASKEQMNCLIDFITQNNTMIPGRSHPLNNNSNEFWTDLTNILNNMQGARKTQEQWKRVFIELKSKTKSKARKEANEMKRTGGGTLNPESMLSKVEQKMLQICGVAEVFGDPELEEIGIDSNNQSSENIIIVQDFEDDSETFNADEYTVGEPSVCREQNQEEKENVRTTIKNIRGEKPSVARKRKNYNSKITNLTQNLQLYNKTTLKLVNSLDSVGNGLKLLAEANMCIANALASKSNLNIDV